VVLAGLLLIVPNFDFGNQITQGALWGTASGLSFALLSLANKHLVQSHPPMVLAAGQNIVASIVLLPLLFGQSRWPGFRSLLLLAFLGIGCTALAHTLFIKSLAHIRAQVAAVATGLEPLYGIIFAFLLLGEVPGWRTLAGGSLILGAVALATVERGRVRIENAAEPRVERPA
jgi:drug/metabolite transporter (DMT)-like permease